MVIHRPRLLLLALLLTSSRYAAAQSSPPSPQAKDLDDDDDLYRTNFSPSLAVIIVVLIFAFFFMGFFSLYIRRCSTDRSAVAPAGAAAHLPRGAAARGLDVAVLSTYPTLEYSKVKELKIGKDALECAVCLCEFADGETLRLLPPCSHVFHPDCIDAWLASHVTCPVCRKDLAVAAIAAEDSEAEQNGAVVVEVAGGEEEEERRRELAELERIGSRRRAARLPRSRSTGHWAAGSGAGDRFTLRLPEHVRKEIVDAGVLRRSASFAAPFPAGGEGSTRRGYRGEGSSRGRRWAAFTRTLSARVTSAWRWAGEEDGGSVRRGEGSTRRGGQEGSVKGGGRVQFDCLGGGGGGRLAGDDGEETSTAPSAKV